MNTCQRGRVMALGSVWLTTLVIILMLIPASPAQAAPLAQPVLSFDDPIPQTGRLDGSTPQVSYVFECRSKGVGSLVAQTTSGDLVVEATLQDAAGNVFARGTVVQATPGVTVAEAFTMPADGDCLVTLSRRGDTAGTYSVRLLPGFAQLTAWDTFAPVNDGLHLEWEPYASQNMTVTTFREQLRIEVMTDNLLAYAVPSGEDLIWTDSYIQADFSIQGAPSYFEYGFILRDNEEQETFYSVTFSSDGDYSVYYFNGDWIAVQDWTVHEAIDPTDMQPRVAVLVQDNRFLLFFNDRFVAEVIDPNRYASEGLSGLVAATGPDQADALTVFTDNVIVTRPYGLGTTAAVLTGQDIAQPTPTKPGLLGALGAVVTPTPTVSLPVPSATPASASRFPAQLGRWSSDTPADIVSELSQAGAVPAGGGIGLTVPSSYGDTSNEGFSSYPLGQGKIFRNFVLGFDARLIYGNAEAGCGMYFRANDGSDTVMVFADGWALLGEWDAEGNLLDSSVLDQFFAVTPGVGATNRVLLVALEDTVAMYVNGALVAESRFTPDEGPVALEMYVPTDDSGATEQTYCQLNNIWLWEF
ncbi:MAG: hypothetical protein Kow00106_22810 [Anaerolineae bacterium]